MDDASRAGAPRAVEHELGAADVHVEQLARFVVRVDHRGRVEHRRRADAVEQPVEGGRVTHVADDRLDLGRHHLEERRGIVGVNKATDPVTLADERADQVLAEPTRGTGHDDGARGMFGAGPVAHETLPSRPAAEGSPRGRRLH